MSNPPLWDSCRLGDLAEFIHGFAFKGEHFSDSPTADVLLTPGNFRRGGGFSSDSLKYYEGPVPLDYVLSEGDLLVTMTDLSKAADTLGYPALVPKAPDGVRFLHNQRLARVLVKDRTRLDTRFLYYLLCSREYRNEILAGATGTTVRHTSPSRIAAYEFLLPSLPEQQEIAHILGSLDDKIELNRRMNGTLEAMASAIFRSWFVDFDPVTAKMQGREPVGMDAATAALFPDEFEDSELGQVPKGWELVPLSTVMAVHDAKRIPLSSRERAKRQGRYPYYGAAGILDWVDDFLFDGVYVLVGEDGSVIDDHDHPVVQHVWGQFWVSNHAHVLTGEGGISTEHLLLFLRSVNIRPFVTGAVQPKLNQGNLKSVPFIRPSGHVSEAFEETVAPLFSLLRHNDDQIRTLAAAREALLPKLLSGELRMSIPNEQDS